MSDQKNNSNIVAQKKYVSRLMAVQSLYSIDISDYKAQKDISDEEFISFFQEHAKDSIAGAGNIKCDKKLFLTLARGASDNITQLDKIIEEFLDDDWSLKRIGELLRAILRVASYEMQELTKNPTKVIISQYLSITKSFFEGSEVDFVNAMLDKIGNKVRGNINSTSK